MYKSLFIDLDDTLWDTAHNNKACLEEVFDVYHWARHYKSFEAFFAIYWPHNMFLWDQYSKGLIDKQTLVLERFAFVLRPMGISDRKEILAVNHDFLMRTTTKTRIVEGAIELLDYLRYHYRMFILSNGFREVQFLKMKNSGLLPYFEKLVLSEDAKAQKPSKEIFDYALQSTNSRCAESLMIGDAISTDIRGAFNAGMDQIWFNPKQLSAPDFTPTYTVNRLLDICHIL